MHTLHSANRTLYKLYTIYVYPTYGYLTLCIPYSIYTLHPYTLDCGYPTLCMPYTMYTSYIVYHAHILYTVSTLHYVYATLYIPFTAYSPPVCILYTLNFLLHVRNYTKYILHRGYRILCIPYILYNIHYAYPTIC